MKTLSLLLALLLGAALVAGAADKATISDDEIYDKVRLKLVSDAEVKGSHIEVKVTDGVVELSGTVRQEKAKTKAEKLARKVKGVRSVVNQLKVTTS
jgi:hyperosmotically inducible periplasmic protein